MFIELHTRTHKPIIINIGLIQYLMASDANDKNTVISVPNCNGSLVVEEPYDKVRELIDNATRR